MTTFETLLDACKKENNVVTYEKRILHGYTSHFITGNFYSPFLSKKTKALVKYLYQNKLFEIDFEPVARYRDEQGELHVIRFFWTERNILLGQWLNMFWHITFLSAYYGVENVTKALNERYRKEV